MAKPRAQTDTVAEIKGLPQLLRVLSKLPKDLQAEVRDASQEIANSLVEGAKSAAHTPLQRKAAGALKAKRDRVPVVKAGGMAGTVPVKDIFYGAEFGGGSRPETQQFLAHKGRTGYFLYPTARANGRRYTEMWAEAVDKAFKQWDYRAH